MSRALELAEWFDEANLSGSYYSYEQEKFREAAALLRAHHEALEPFAQTAKRLDDDLMKAAGKVWGDGYRPVGNDVPPISDFRRARSVYGGNDDEA